MELAGLIAALSDAAAYPRSGSAAIGTVELHQTHLSVVFLAGDRAYKIKKPVDLGFVDYRTLEARRRFCEREVALNRRLAPSVYLGVVPITRAGERVRVEGEGPGEVVEWAVKMVRLPEHATLREGLRRGDVGLPQARLLAERIAAFHARAGRGPEVSAFGRYEVVAGNALENFDQSARHVGTTVSPSVFARLRRSTEAALANLKSVIEARAAGGVPRDGHGDLRLDHVYLFEDREPPADLVIVDCIEFNDRFRCADPVADMAFLVMEFLEHGRRDLALAFTDAYFAASADDAGRILLPFYTAYRAAVRGKVEGMKHEEPEVPQPERTAALQRARAHWLLALGELEPPERRPCVVLVGGLPGVGKSTLARGLVERAGFTGIRTDEMRKEIARAPSAPPAPASYEGGIYSPEWTARTYAECLRRAEDLLFQGRRVLVDANFRTEESRRRFLDAATRWGVPSLFLSCQAAPEVVRARLRDRTGDASDADWSIHVEAASRWEAPGPSTRPVVREIETGGKAEDSLARALEFLRGLGLAADGVSEAMGQ